MSGAKVATGSVVVGRGRAADVLCGFGSFVRLCVRRPGMTATLCDVSVSVRHGWLELRAAVGGGLVRLEGSARVVLSETDCGCVLDVG